MFCDEISEMFWMGFVCIEGRIYSPVYDSNVMRNHFWQTAALLLPLPPPPLSLSLSLSVYTGCPRRNVPDFGRVFRMLKYTDITQNTYVQTWMVMEIMAREKCGLLAGPRTVPVSWQPYLCYVVECGVILQQFSWFSSEYFCAVWKGGGTND
jgi:hypothetical protein